MLMATVFPHPDEAIGMDDLGNLFFCGPALSLPRFGQRKTGGGAIEVITEGLGCF